MNIYSGIGVHYPNGDCYDIVARKTLPCSDEGDYIAVLQYNYEDSLRQKVRSWYLIREKMSDQQMWGKNEKDTY